jgi:hypothetical protein
MINPRLAILDSGGLVLPVRAGRLKTGETGTVAWGRTSAHVPAPCQTLLPPPRRANNDFYVRRARLRADASVSDFLRGRVVSEFGGSGSGVVLDADISLVFSDAAVLSFGQFKRAFDLFHVPNPSDLPEIERQGQIEGTPPAPAWGRSAPTAGSPKGCC